MACRHPPHDARLGSTVFHSVFHPSDAASSAEGDHTASRAGCLGGDDASAAADNWLLEEGSGASPDSLSSLWKHSTVRCNALHGSSLATNQGTLHPEGSSAAIAGYSSIHAGTETEEGHATAAPQSSSWHPDDHHSGAGPLGLLGL